MTIRPYATGEEMLLYDVFFSSIHENAHSYYSEAQLNAWAPEAVDRGTWSRRIKKINPFVLEDKGSILGYGDLQDSGLIDHFFIGGGHAGKGLGRQLMIHILEEARKRNTERLFSHVSLAAQPFFEKFGFVISERNKVLIRGVTLENALMHREMDRIREGLVHPVLL